MNLSRDFTRLAAKSPQELGVELADNVITNWFDSGHSFDRERIERSYAVAALEGQISGYWPRWDQPEDEVIREVMKAAMDYLEDVIAYEEEPEVKSKKRKRKTK